MNRSRKKKSSPLHKVLDIIIGLMCVATVGAAAFTIHMFHDEWDYSYDQESFYYNLEDERFYQMVEMYYMNEFAGVKSDKTLEPYYGVVRYFEAASYYKAYQDAGDEIQMKKYHEQMQQAKAQMKELKIAVNIIDKKLNITE